MNGIKNTKTSTMIEIVELQSHLPNVTTVCIENGNLWKPVVGVIRPSKILKERLIIMWN